MLLIAAQAEAARARTLFPGSRHLALALAEESGEVTKAVLDHWEGKGNIRQVDKELVHCVATCLRLWEEGDCTVNLPSVRDAIGQGIKGDGDAD